MNFIVDKENSKLLVEREFAAPLANVWAAFTQAELLDQWWAPKPWQARTKSMDFREGGFWLYAMIGPEGEEHWGRTDYETIEPQKSFSAWDSFTDPEGNINPDFPRAAFKNEFRETGDTTTVSMVTKYDKLSDLEMVLNMGMQEGLTAALENLDALLERQKA
ncbi:MAG TPA: SRPBCC domain-containing protein [Adhaeribacter sp.]|nr:SRPBCC domain-containing protein [Adhaeribacter sp.]